MFEAILQQILRIKQRKKGGNDVIGENRRAGKSSLPFQSAI